MSERPQQGLLSLINGDVMQGSVMPGDSVESIGWQGTSFVSPFQFRLGTIRSIKFPSKRRSGDSGGPFSFELTTGDMIVGKLVGLNDQAVDIDADSIGVISIRPELLRRVHRIDDQAAVTFSSLQGMEGWRNVSAARGGWVEDGDQIGTVVRGATVRGDLGVPPRAVIDVELSWGGTPDFVLALGVDPEAIDDSKQDGWRLETFASGLGIVREEGDRAEVASIADLSKLGRIRLIIYVDQEQRTMEVMGSDGISIGRISLSENSVEGVAPNLADAATGGIRIVNRGESLRLERLHIARWVGGIPSGDLRGQASIALADGSIVSGSVTGFDSAANRLELAGASQSPAVDLSQVVAIRFAPKVSNADPGQCALFLHDGMRLSGKLVQVDERQFVLGGEHYVREVKLPNDRVRTLVVFESDAANVESKPVLGRVGRLEIGSDRSSGRLIEVAGPVDPDAFPLVWHPLNSTTSAPIRRSVMGKVVYRDPPKIDSQSAAARMLAQQRLRSQQQRRGLNFGELFLQRADLTKASPVKRDAHVVHLRSGDVIACRVDAIDEKGLILSTANSDRGFVPHEQIKAVEFVSNSPPPSIDDAKRDRLLTVPRLQKTAPPSHLLCSHNGDFLRCRLLASQDDMFRVEIQLEEVLVPRNRVAQIIWFHSDEVEESDEAANRQQLEAAPGAYQGLIQVVLNDGKRVTFTPEGFSEGSIQGTSQWVGNCQFDMGDVDQLLLGDQIAIEVADVSYNQWKLQPAIEPLVTAAMKGDGSSPSKPESPLVGSEAPEIKLALLDGDPFVLSETRGKIIVLEFWASWNGPCMQTMPLIQQAISEFDPSLVRLVAVNLQESADQIESVLKRHQIESTVALDIDGVTALKYQISVIPQIVVIDADGNVKGLYVGGGMETVERMQEDIRALLDAPPPR